MPAALVTIAQVARPIVARQPQAAGQAPQAPAPAPLARRALLAGAGLTLLAGAPAADAAIGRWDGESSAIGSCALGEAGADCRRAILSEDAARFESYEKATSEVGKVGTNSNVPAAAMDSAYVQSTLALTDKFLAYASFADPTDPERLKLVGELKKDMPAWTAKYARGGSARTVSARKIYVVVDALSGHLASNGLAPLPRPKLAKLVADVEAGRELLVAGK